MEDFKDTLDRTFKKERPLRGIKVIKSAAIAEDAAIPGDEPGKNRNCRGQASSEPVSSPASHQHLVVGAEARTRKTSRGLRKSVYGQTESAPML